ncbi:hypothetical protein ACOMHN_017151 [Nucella lapillus]
MFLCRNGRQHVQYSLLCDHHNDCNDESDEDFCAFPAPPSVIHFTGTGSSTVTAVNGSSVLETCPETHFQCPDDGYCLPVYVRCNGVLDCPQGADEAACDSYTCPGTVFPGFTYASNVMIVFNFIIFLLIAVGQFFIFWSIRSQRKTVRSSRKKAQDMAIARRLLAVVMTDFLCWFPIGLLGMMARNGVPISGHVNVAMAIFVLPFNSALNPFLYTFHMLLERRGSSRAEPKSGEGRQRTSRACPTCAKREQGVSHDAHSLAVAERVVFTSMANKDYTADPKVFNLIETVLKEKQMTLDCFLCHLTRIMRKRKSLNVAHTSQS